MAVKAIGLFENTLLQLLYIFHVFHIFQKAKYSTVQHKTCYTTLMLIQQTQYTSQTQIMSLGVMPKCFHLVMMLSEILSGED